MAVASDSRIAVLSFQMTNRRVHGAESERHIGVLTRQKLELLFCFEFKL